MSFKTRLLLILCGLVVGVILSSREIYAYLTGSCKSGYTINVQRQLCERKVDVKRDCPPNSDLMINARGERDACVFPDGKSEKKDWRVPWCELNPRCFLSPWCLIDGNRKYASLHKERGVDYCRYKQKSLLGGL